MALPRARLRSISGKAPPWSPAPGRSIPVRPSCSPTLKAPTAGAVEVDFGKGAALVASTGGLNSSSTLLQPDPQGTYRGRG
jgi:hypothetical protein